MKENKKMNCPACGAEMNHHADKLIFSESRNELKLYDEKLGGIIEEYYKCPVCRSTYTQKIKEQKPKP